MKNKGKIFAVAPMIDWTDRHCRFFHRQLSHHALLYTEMVVDQAIIHGEAERLLADDTIGKKFGDIKSRVALQLGGSEPELLGEAIKLAESFGYCEYNLNVGCPSDRVQAGTFGAVLMKTPNLVGRCVAAMKEVTGKPVTVKCRLGVDDQDIGRALDDLSKAVWAAGADALWVHARKAWLDGLSPKENRDIPPLDYERVRRLKHDNPSRFIGLNGGLEDGNHALEEITRHEVNTLDGAMLGRAAYQKPAILRDIDRLFYNANSAPVDWHDLFKTMADYAEQQMIEGRRLHHITRHMVGLFHGVRGGRRWRQILSDESHKEGADPKILEQAFKTVELDEGFAA